MPCTKELIKGSRFRARVLISRSTRLCCAACDRFCKFYVCHKNYTIIEAVTYTISFDGPVNQANLSSVALCQKKVIHLSLGRVCRKVCTLRQRHTQTTLQKVISPTAEAWTLYWVSELMVINLTKGIKLSLAFPYIFSKKWSWHVTKMAPERIPRLYRTNLKEIYFIQVRIKRADIPYEYLLSM